MLTPLSTELNTSDAKYQFNPPNDVGVPANLSSPFYLTYLMDRDTDADNTDLCYCVEQRTQGRVTRLLHLASPTDGSQRCGWHGRFRTGAVLN